MKFEISNKERNKMLEGVKVKHYYQNDFITHYARDAIQLPIGRTIQNTLVTDNWISKTVNRYASASVGKNASIETGEETLQALLDDWHSDIDFSAKLTTVARYQGLYGYAVAKIVFTHPRDEVGNIILSSKKPEDFLAGVDLAIFGGDVAFYRNNEYGNLETIVIMMGNTVEVFYLDRVETYSRNTIDAAYKLDSVQPNPIYPQPLAFVVKNIETGGHASSDVAGIVSLQEALNDALTSSRLNAHYHGFPIYTATGVAPTYRKDAEGNLTDIPVPLAVGAGMTLQTESDSAKFGRIEAASASESIATVESITKEIAVATNSLSLLTGQIPSGTALAYMLTDFNSSVSEKQEKLKNFMQRLHKSVFRLLDYSTSTSYSSIKPKAYVSGNNPIQRDYDFQQAKEARAIGGLSLKTFLDNLEIVDNTEEELERLNEEAAQVGTANPLTSLLGG